MRKIEKLNNMVKANLLVEQRYLSLKENNGPIDYSLDFNGWTNGRKIRVLRALEKIEAPAEWKKMVLKSEKIADTAKNILRRHGGGTWLVRQKVEENYGDKWDELMEIIGNTGVSLNPNENTVHWEEYCKLMGSLNSFNFSDTLA